jgi:hypothetical protein
MLERIITGGQTGADQAGWRAARAAGIPTGEWMTRGFFTEAPDGRGEGDAGGRCTEQRGETCLVAGPSGSGKPAAPSRFASGSRQSLPGVTLIP